MALMVYKTCCKVEGGLPTGVKIQMMINIIVDFVIGLVPFLGDMADALFRANTRNVILLEEHLREKGKKDLRKSGMPVPDLDPSSPVEFDRYKEEEHGTLGGRVPAEPAAAMSKNGRSRPADEEMGYGTTANATAGVSKNKKSGRK